MPALPRLRLAPLAELAVQLRFAPPETLARHAMRIVELAGDIDPDRAYPADWVVFRVTGYRPEPSTPGAEAPALLVGAAVLGDLSALAERLSDRARLNPEQAGPGALGVADLCARWRITRKTLERYRRAGLIALRITDRASGAVRTRLAFPHDSVERFERAHAARLNSAARFARTEPDWQRDVWQRAAQLRSERGWTLNRCAQTLARETGKPRQTIRRILERADAPHAVRTFHVMRHAEPRERTLCLRAVRLGVDPDELAQRIGRSRGAVLRAAQRERADRLRALLCGDHHAPNHSAPDDASFERALAMSTVRFGLELVVPRTADELAELARAMPAADPREERARALAAGALLARARAMAESWGAAPTPGAIDEAETMLRWATLLHAALVHSMTPLAVRTIEERLGTPLTQAHADVAGAMHRAAFLALARAVEKFDATRGGRLAAAASVALARALAHVEAPARAGRAAPGRIALDDWRAAAAPWLGWMDPPRRLHDSLGLLDDRSRALIGARYGWSGAAPLTVKALCAQFGTSPAGFASLLRRALMRTAPRPADAP